MAAFDIPSVEQALSALVAAGRTDAEAGVEGAADGEAPVKDSVALYALRQVPGHGVHMGHVSHSSHVSGSGGYGGHVSHSSHSSHTSHVSGAHYSHVSGAHSSHASASPTPAPHHLLGPRRSASARPTPSAASKRSPKPTPTTATATSRPTTELRTQVPGSGRSKGSNQSSTDSTSFWDWLFAIGLLAALVEGIRRWRRRRAQ